MAVLEFKLRFFGSILGYFWQLMRPLLLFGVLYVVFTQAFPLGEGVPYYPVLLLTGIVIYHVLRRRHEQRGVRRWWTARTSCARSTSRGSRSRPRSC